MSAPEELIHAQCEDFKNLLATMTPDQKAEVIFGFLAFVQSHLIELLDQ